MLFVLLKKSAIRHVFGAVHFLTFCCLKYKFHLWFQTVQKMISSVREREWKMFQKIRLIIRASGNIVRLHSNQKKIKKSQVLNELCTESHFRFPQLLLFVVKHCSLFLLTPWTRGDPKTSCTKNALSFQWTEHFLCLALSHSICAITIVNVRIGPQKQILNHKNPISNLKGDILEF